MVVNQKYFFFSYLDNFYTFALYGGTGAGAGYSPKSETTFDQILSTFKFTNESANWQTYQETGYSIKLPSVLIPSTNNYQGIGGLVNTNIFTKSDRSYSISVYSYKTGVKSMLEFNQQSQPTQTIETNGQIVNKIVSLDETLIQIGPIKNLGNEYMIIYSSGISKNNEGFSLFEQALSTFKFMQ